MTEQRAFLAAIKAEPENYLHRKVYADWLDEHDMPEEANRQRAFEDADRWLREFHAAEFGPWNDDGDDDGDDADPQRITYTDMLEAAKSNPGSVIMTLPFDSPSVDVQRFWECIQIVAGVIVYDKTTFPFRCAC